MAQVQARQQVEQVELEHHLQLPVQALLAEVVEAVDFILAPVEVVEAEQVVLEELQAEVLRVETELPTPEAVEVVVQQAELAVTVAQAS